MTARRLTVTANKPRTNLARMDGSEQLPRVLSIAGSDSGGGAGIQADLRAFAACGVHGMTAVTAITAQNTVGVSAVHSVPPETIVAQVRAVASDIGVDAVKIGMLGDVRTIAAVAEALAELSPAVPVVLDPVMVAESGAELLDPTAHRALVELMLPRAAIATPNIPEAQVLTGLHGAGQEELARSVRALGPSAVIVTGGHSDRVVDVFFDGSELVEISGERHPGGAAHGSGCTHSSGVAAALAWGVAPLEAARFARELAGKSVRDGLASIGQGPGPVDALGVMKRAQRWRRENARPLT